MLPENTPKLALKDVVLLIEKARNAELCRDTDSLQNILQNVWNFNESAPYLQESDILAQAEILRLVGFYLTHVGRARNLTDYQTRAKDALTRAIEIFETEGLADKAAESKIILAFCYWNRGEVEECEALLGLIENEFGENKFHPVYLQLNINRMMLLCWQEKFDEAYLLLNDLTPAMEFCRDERLSTLFNFEAAILSQRLGKFQNAVSYFQEAIRLTKKNENLHLLALTYNNLSLLYLEMKKFGEAHALSDKSLSALRKIDHTGWIPHVLDSKALIYLEEKKFDHALKAVDQALEYFYRGEDYKGLTASLWTKVRIFLALDKSESAIVVFAELELICAQQIGETAVRKYAKKLNEEIYILRRLPLPEEIDEFKKTRITSALIETGGAVSAAAEILGLENHQSLSYILNKQFPDLMEKLGFQKRARRGAKEQTEMVDGRTVTLKDSDIKQEHEVSRLVLRDKDFSFDFNVMSEKFDTFYFDKFLMRKFGIRQGAIVAVVPVKDLRVGQTVVVSHENLFVVGQIERDEWANVHFISAGENAPIPLDENNVVGEPVGYCPVGSANKKFIEFSRLS